MKILDFAPYYPPHIGGMEKYIEELHDELTRSGCEIIVFTPHLPSATLPEETRGTIRIIRYPAIDIIFNYPLPCFWKKVFWYQWKKITSEKFDVVFSTLRFFLPSLIAVFFSRRYRVPLIHIEHCSDYVKNRLFISLLSRIVDFTMGRFILRQAHHIITVSQSSAHFVKLLSGRASTVIYRGMPLEAIDTLPAHEVFRTEHSGEKIITFVGRLIYGKGVIHLLEAIQQLQRSDIHVCIIGDGPERIPLEKYTTDHALSSQITFFGSQPFPQVIGLLKVTDIFVNPSYTEGLPTSVLEAGAAGSAIIATDVGGTREIIQHNRSGLLIKPKSTQAVREALQKLLDNPELRNTLRIHAREAIEEKFHWHQTIEKYLAIMYRLKQKS